MRSSSSSSRSSKQGDIIIDGGNSLWTDTQRREKRLKEKGIHFFGVGVSGGEEGALKGPSHHARRLAGRLGSRSTPIYTKHRRHGRGRAVLPPHGPRRRGPLCEDGAQRHRVRRHAAHLRGLRHPEGDASTPAPRSFTRSSPSGTTASWTASSSRSPRTSSARKTPKPASRSSISSSTKPARKAPANGPWATPSRWACRSPSSAPPSKRASFPRMKDERVAASKALTGPTPKPYTGDRTSADRSGARRALRQQDHQLRAGPRATRQSERALQLEPQLRRHRRHLARRLHHPRRASSIASPRPTATNPGSRTSCSHPFFTRHPQRGPRPTGATPSPTAIEHGIAVPAFSAALGYFDSYRARTPPRQPAPGPARLLRRPHLRAHRQARRRILPH